MSDLTIKSVVIVGGTIAAWMSASTLVTMLGGSVAITVVETADLNQANNINASLPPIKALHQMLGIDEADLLSKTRGSMKLGTQFVNWGSLGNRYLHPHGSYGAEFDPVALHQWWLRACQEGDPAPPLEALSFANALITEGRFTHPVQDRRLIQATFDYAYHLDESLYKQYLAALAKSRGVRTIEAEVKHATLNSETGHIEALLLSDGQSISADLYIDCSGSRGVLIKEALKADFEDWSASLPCDTMIGVSCEAGTDFSPVARITAREAGWQWRTPLQNQTSTGYVFSSRHQSQDEALGSLFDNLDGRALGEPTLTTFHNGRLITPFSKKVVALGEAAGYLEPFEATALHFVQSGLTRLLALWPTTSFDPIIAQEYNKVTQTEWDLARDFLVLHYHASNRVDTPFWQQCKLMPISNSLSHRLAHWRASGRLISPQAEVFQPASWLSIYIGQGIMPSGRDPLVDARQNSVDSIGRLEGIARIIAETASQMPLHKDVIDKSYKARRT